ncbi:MAG: hypothetical protein ACD_7C00444G0003 [uncultured bacterium]|nr:MAG: hypothetical protein ACD_7C00444G0003 [uncultured bacterium]
MKKKLQKNGNKNKTISKISLGKTKSFLYEVWDNKILSLFYLIVIGANLFNISRNFWGITEVWQKILVAVSLPLLFVFLVSFLVIFIFEKFKNNKIVKIIKEAIREFFKIFEDDDHDEVVKAVSMTMKQRAYYIAMDYWAVFGAIFVVSILSYFNRGFIEIFLATATYDFLVAWGFMIYSLKTGNDVTFGEGYRRAIDVVHRESKIVGYIGMILLNLKAVIWDGPEQVPIFFKKEIGGLTNMTFILFFLATFQGLFWAWLYSYGYESVLEAVKSII